MNFLKNEVVVNSGTLIMVILFFTAMVGLLVYALFSSTKKILVLRHEFIKFSDWSANTLIDVSESATEAIVKEVLNFRPNLSRADAELFVPTTVSNASKEWRNTCDKFQVSLVRNGIEALNSEDVQFILSPHFK
jgi:molecular chaperone GrpE (heat shock protein)